MSVSLAAFVSVRPSVANKESTNHPRSLQFAAVSHEKSDYGAVAEPHKDAETLWVGAVNSDLLGQLIIRLYAVSVDRTGLSHRQVALFDSNTSQHHPHSLVELASRSLSLVSTGRHARETRTTRCLCALRSLLSCDPWS